MAVVWAVAGAVVGFVAHMGWLKLAVVLARQSSLKKLINAQKLVADAEAAEKAVVDARAFIAANTSKLPTFLTPTGQTGPTGP